MSDAPDAARLGAVAAEHLPPILYALELTALSMEQTGRDEDARYFRELARLLSDAAAGAPAERAGG